ncbi:hypothetical protein SDC9_182698 [bioreactor metagenome]|uniref:Uncharacterized protein n=1 Tax=bioreactor metagenome TaxID=1076179 RepID=A0A645H846_9ZZZZ
MNERMLVYVAFGCLQSIVCLMKDIGQDEVKYVIYLWGVKLTSWICPTHTKEKK